MKALSTAEKNLTIAYDQTLRPYHPLLADLLDDCLDRSFATPDILDFGCGVGNTLVEVRKRRPGSAFVACDVDARCLELTALKTEIKESLLLDDVDQLVQDGRQFDAILLSHTLHYAPDPARLMHCLALLLKPGGVLLLASPNPITPQKLMSALLRRHSAHGVYAWDRAALLNFMDSVPGIEVERVTQDFLPMPWARLNHMRVLSGLLRKLGQLFPQLAFSIVVVLRKSASSSE